MNRKANTSIFRNFDKLSTNVIIEDFDAAKEFLAELKIDTDELSLQGANEFKKAIFLAKAKANQRLDQSLLKKLKDKIKESMERNAILTGEILKDFFSEKKVSFQFRNLEKWSDDDLREVLGDIDLTKLLEDLDDMEDQ
ncbi:hypothetical protein LZF95_03280 [Algoriphagus sp. AGSA1]|uniref:hypothetical protein n=1 Tax=Algoriphagus sp. AGSA1 TaxID=2907213 RepID=UPI001F218F71|nr:hypothetical protein [Algoriphagus sp. AGSA1]MCE7053686.1 hypothetical protein [Algoriphagus sp. AGSA1]